MSGKIIRFAMLLLLLLLALPAAAQDLVVGGLVNPRGLAFDSEGNLYVVETGNGGIITVSSGRFPIATGSSGQVTRVSPEGDVDVIILGLPSRAVSDSRGVSDIRVTEDMIWLVIGQAPEEYPFSMGLAGLDRETRRIRHFVDLYTVEFTENPDGDVVESNPVDFAVAEDGTFYIVDASCNCMFSWSEAGGIGETLAWSAAAGEEHRVPTAVSVGPDGDLYVGFLTAFPFPQGQAVVERWSGGELVETYPGLTAVTDVLVATDGTIYAVELGVLGDVGFGPGRVVRVTPDGPETVLDGLNQPYALAMDAEGNLYVSVNSTGGADGQVLRISMS